MGSSLADEPGFMPAARPVTFRAYRVENEWFKNGKRVIDLEVYFRQHDKRLLWNASANPELWWKSA